MLRAFFHWELNVYKIGDWESRSVNGQKGMVRDHGKSWYELYDLGLLYA